MLWRGAPWWCTRAGACSAGGSYLDSSGFAQAWVASTVTSCAQVSRCRAATVAGTPAAPQRPARVSPPITAETMMTALLQEHVTAAHAAAGVPAVSVWYFLTRLAKPVRASAGLISWIVAKMP